MMTKEQIYESLNTIFQDVFDDDEIVVNPSTCANDIENWDSFEHINLMVEIEHEFNVKFDIEEAKGFTNVGEMVEPILNKMNKN